MKKIYLLSIFIAIIILKLPAQSNSEKMTTDSLIIAALNQVNTDSLHADVQALQNMGTRFMIAENRKQVATWIMDKFLSMGITEVRLDSFLCYTHINYPGIVYDTTTWQYNVEAKLEGIEFPEEEVLMLGHYDDFSEYSDPLMFAPGADDNASGTAATLECARVIMAMGYQPAQTIIFLADAAEELMYFGDAGTEHYAREAEEGGRNIGMVLNNDMIGWNDGSWTLFLTNQTFSTHITYLAVEIIENYTTLNYELSELINHVGADIQPFLDAGYPGVYFMEHNLNPQYHNVGDTLENCDINYLAEITKVNLGCLLKSDLTVGLEKMKTELREISVYPNPAHDEISFWLNDPHPSSIELKISNLNGQEFYHGQCIQGNNRLNVSFLEEGFYMMIFRNEQKIRYQKLVIVR